MEVHEHLRRAASFEAAIQKIDPLEDGALYVVFLMRAGTNRINAALHMMGITDVSASAHRIGDLNHTYKPKLERVPPEVQRMFEPLSFIENLRPQHVRGAEKLTADLIRQCRQAYQEIVGRTAPILESSKET